jgi:CDP-diglyceride synthetase
MVVVVVVVVFLYLRSHGKIHVRPPHQLTMIGLSTFWILTIQQYGMKWIAYPFALVAINDTMAYVFGVLFGKHPLLAQISPKKTWEGFIGAAVSTMGLSVPLWGLMFGPTSATATTTATSIHLPHVIALAAYVSLVAPFGGFLASIVKRTYGHKDFGNLIPGHGGIVDRLDCQLMVAPLVYLGLQHFGTAAAS